MMHHFLTRKRIFAGVLYTFVIFVISYNRPFSKLYKSVHSYDSLFKKVQNANTDRALKAEAYFKNQTRNALSTINNFKSRLKTNVSIAIGLITVKRKAISAKNLQDKSVNYITQSAAFLHNMVQSYPFLKKAVPFICNVDSSPSLHLQAKKLYDFILYTERFGNNSLYHPPLHIPNTNTFYHEMKNHSSRYSKESFDYAFCLQTGAMLNAEYVLLLEDDVLPHKDFPHVLEHLLASRLSLSKNVHYKDGFIYLKMYFPSKWQGYGMELVTIFDLISISAVGAALFTLLLRFLSNVIYKNDSIVSNNLFRCFTVSFFLVMLACWFIGRQNVNELRRFSKYFYRLKPSEGCCTQAMLYPSNVCLSIARYLVKASPSTHTDLVIMDYASENPLPALQIEPNLFYHVGLITSLSNEQKHPEEFILSSL